LGEVATFTQAGTRECIYTYIGVKVYICAYTHYYISETGLLKLVFDSIHISSKNTILGSDEVLILVWHYIFPLFIVY